MPAPPLPPDLPEPRSAPEPSEQACLAAGAALFAAGQHWHAHEAWEQAFRRCPPGPVRSLFQGLIQIAAGLHLLLRTQRAAGGLRNLEKAAGKLAPLPSPLLGVDVDALRAALGRLRAEPLQGDPAAAERFNQPQQKDEIERISNIISIVK